MVDLDLRTPGLHSALPICNISVSDDIGTDNFRIGSDGAGDNDFGGMIDEVAIWNRSLTVSEISDLYNLGVGIYYGMLELNLTSPEDNHQNTSNIVIFNCSALDGIQIDNLSLIIDGEINTTITGTSPTLSLETQLNMSFGAHTWNCNATNSMNNLGTGVQRSLTLGFEENSQTYNTTTYETSSETFFLNISYNDTSFTSATASLVYNGTSYSGIASGTGSEKTFTKTMDVATVSGQQNKSFFWNVSLVSASGTTYYTSTTYNQSVNPINLTLCEGAPQDTVYLNFTFKDEAAGTLMSARNDLTDFDYWLGSGSVTKSFTMTNTSVNPSYAFCMNPPDRPVEVDLSFKYSNATHPLRTFAYDDQSLTNTTTNQILYLLGTASGIYSSISVIETSGAPISSVAITLERQFSGVWTLIEQGITGDDGLTTFWVNPNFEHRITAIKTGYVTSQQTITPSQSLYTLTLAKTAGNATYVSNIPGLKWVVYPGAGPIDAGSTTFNLTMYSTELNIEDCKFELLNLSGSILASATGSTVNTSYCFATFDYTLIKDQNVFGRASVDTTATDGYVYVDVDWKWIVIDIDAKAWRSVTNFFSELKGLSEFGEGNEAEFSRIVLFFLLVTVFVGIFIYFTGVELEGPGITILIIMLIIFFASAGGFLTFDSGSDNVNSTMEQWGFFFIFLILTIGFVINTIRRTGEI